MDDKNNGALEDAVIYAVIPRQGYALPAVIRLQRVGQTYTEDKAGVNWPSYLWKASVEERFDKTKEAKAYAQAMNEINYSPGQYAAAATRHSTSTSSIGESGYFAFDPCGGPIFAITEPPPEAAAVTNSVYLLGRPGSIAPKIEVKK